MKFKSLFLLIAIALLSTLVACISTPKTASEFKSIYKGSSFANNDSFEVSQSITDLSRVFKRKVSECLNYSYENTMSTPGAYGGTRSTSINTVKTKISSDAKSILIEIFQKESADISGMGSHTPDGMYLLVVEATQVTSGKTKIDVYRRFGGAIAASIKNWSNGEVRGCPDPTKTMDQ